MNQSSKKNKILPDGAFPNIYNRSTPKRNPASVGTRTIHGSKCFNCFQQQQAVGCLECYKLFCINCAINHSKEFSSHTVKDLKETYTKIFEQVQLLDNQIKNIRGTFNLKSNDIKKELKDNIFEAQKEKVIVLQKQIESMVTNFFQKVQQQFILLQNNYLEMWGPSELFQERLHKIQLKLMQFIKNDSLDYSLEVLFREKSIQESKRILLQYEKRLELQQEEKQQTIYPPRLLIDLSFCSKFNLILNQMIQVIDWKYEEQNELFVINGTDYQNIPIIHTGAKVMYLYNLESREYQVGEFQDLRHKQIPFYIKSIFLENGTQLLVGGADTNGVPVRQFLMVKDEELTNLQYLPKSKNPINALILMDKDLYVIGGMRVEDNKVQWTRSCEKYSIEQNKWITLDPMRSTKPYQTVFRIKKKIYAIGMQQNNETNFECFNTQNNTWSDINLQPISINPFLYGCGYTSVSINEHQAFIFGGKTWNKQNLEDDSEISCEDEIMKTVFCYDDRSNQFISLGDVMPGTGVTYGDFQPICYKNKIIYLEQPISKQKKIHKFLQTINVIELTIKGQSLDAEIVQMMTPD